VDQATAAKFMEVHFKDITSAGLPRTKSYLHGEASWSASVLSSSVGSDFRP
jgi:hypothetical protein